MNFNFVTLQSMKNKENNKAKIIKSISKMISDKEAVRSYIKGEISIETLENKEITLAKPF